MTKENALSALTEMSLEDLVELVAEAVARKIDRAAVTERPKGYWSIDDVAAYYSISVSGVRRKLDAGEIPPADIGGGHGSKLLWKAETLTQKNHP